VNSFRCGRPYQKAADLDAPAAACIVIEDSVPGVRSAEAFGARCPALTKTFLRNTLAAERPDRLSADFRDLPADVRAQGAAAPGAGGARYRW
jgi:beta-phosphoglucomutase-like phosphatase (HAD superfamily)